MVALWVWEKSNDDDSHENSGLRKTTMVWRLEIEIVAFEHGGIWVVGKLFYQPSYADCSGKAKHCSSFIIVVGFGNWETELRFMSISMYGGAGLGN